MFEKEWGGRCTLNIWSINTYFWCNSLFCSAKITLSSAFSSKQWVNTFNFLSKSDLASTRAFSAFWRLDAFRTLSERLSLSNNKYSDHEKRSVDKKRSIPRFSFDLLTFTLFVGELLTCILRVIMVRCFYNNKTW